MSSRLITHGQRQRDLVCTGDGFELERGSQMFLGPLQSRCYSHWLHGELGRSVLLVAPWLVSMSVHTCPTQTSNSTTLEHSAIL